MNRIAQSARAFAVDDADSQDTQFPALVEILRKEFADFRRTEGVEIELAGDRDFDGFFFFHC